MCALFFIFCCYVYIGANKIYHLRRWTIKEKKNRLPRLLIVKKLPFNFSVIIEILIIALSFLIVHRSSEHWFWGQTIYPATRSNSSSLIFAMLVNFQFKFNHGLDGGVWWVDGSTDQAMSIHTHIHSSRTWAPLTIYIKSRGKGDSNG